MRGLLFVLLLTLSVALNVNEAGVPGAACVADDGTPATYDNCGTCAGDGTSCLCLGGYLDFAKQDANAGVLCGVDTSLIAQIDSTIASLDRLDAQLGRTDCDISEQLNFGVWLNEMNRFCSGDACPSLSDPNLYAFLGSNQEFSTNLQRQLNSAMQE